MGATRAIIDTDKFHANLSYLRSHLAGQKICLAVKGNAYGHGLTELSLRAPVDSFAVATLAEGAALRTCGITAPILLLSPHLRQEIPELCELTLEPFVSHAAFLVDYQREAVRRKMTLRLHLKVDTGMGRQGVSPEEALPLALAIVQQPNVELYGLCTHFSSADSRHGDTLEQLKCFRTIREQLARHGIVPACVHAANSAATLNYPASHFDMVRIGIGAYGYCRDPALQPVLSLQSRIGLVKKVPCGHKVSYGGTWQAPRDSVLGLLPIGYADGYSRLLSNRGQVLLTGEPCPVVGRVCMDQVMIDLTEFATRYPARDLLEQEVLLLGQGVDAESLAQQCATIPYEILTSISDRVLRVYL